MVTLDASSIKGVNADISKLQKKLQSEVRGQLIETGRFVQSEAKKRCPVGPTKLQAAKDPEYNYDRKKARGNLRDSIVVRRGRDYVDVGVIQGTALQYANKIHNMRNVKGGWEKLGPGSRAKKGGVRVGEKFIDRAYEENEKSINDFFQKGISTEIEKFNDGN